MTHNIYYSIILLTEAGRQSPGKSGGTYHETEKNMPLAEGIDRTVRYYGCRFLRRRDGIGVLYEAAESSGSGVEFVFFSWYTAVLCYGVLFQFWNVCTQIGRDNSFSLENVRSFHRMAMLGVAAGAGYLVRMVYLIAAGGFRWPVFLYNLALILLSVVFVDALRGAFSAGAQRLRGKAGE